MSTSTAVTKKTAAPPATIRDHLESPKFANQLAMVLPKHITPQRQVRVAITAMMRNPKLMDCDQASFFNAMLTCSQIGLEPDGRLAHLIPYRNNKRNCMEVQLIIDWKGKVQLAYRSGLVSSMHADIVYTGDLFVYNCGVVENHTPHFLRTDKEKPSARGSAIGAYAIAVMKDGTRAACAMSIDEINAIRRRSKSPDSGPWVTDYNEMAKKTVFHRMSKWLPLSSEDFRKALELEDEEEHEMRNVTDTQTAQSLLAPVTPLPIEMGEEEVTTKPDLRAAVMAIVESKGLTFEDFVECLVADNAIKPQDAGTIKAISDVPDAILRDYLGADGAGDNLAQGLAFIVENRKA